MQRQIIYGVPYYIDSANKLYTYSEDKIHIGSYLNNTVTLVSGILETLDGKLKMWRDEQSARIRKPQEPKKDS
jgi:hypothetical protein